jgi:predicted PurR-regulated permease PerM
MLLWPFVSAFLRAAVPWLISQGSDMPFILVFFGVIGVFLGPTLLAVGFRIVEEWTPKPSTDTPPNSP